MGTKRGYFALAGAAVAVAGFMLSPAIGASDRFAHERDDAPVSLGALGSISSFTPTIKDSRLASAYAKIALSASRKSFRFTPTSGSMSGQRSVTVMVRADTDGVVVSRTLPAIQITPVAFSLNSSRNWHRFALPESVGRKDLDPVAIEPIAALKTFSLDQGKKDRFSTKVVMETRRDMAAGLRSPAMEKDYTLDLASSYSLTRNLNVTAGVRYNGAGAGRLAPMTDERQDSQSLYLGTVFKF